MKKLILAFILLSCSCILHAQSYSGVKIFGFQQSVSGGKRPTAAINEKNVAGTVAATPRKNLWLYLALPAKTVVSVTELYMDGKKYKVKTEKIVKTPVEYTDAAIPDEPKTTVMVPATKQPVVKLTPLSAVAFSPNSTLRKLLAANEVVVGYTVKGKKYYTALKKLTYLDPALMQ